MRHRRKDIWEQQWVMIAVVVGIVAVVAIALFVFWGGSSSPSGTTSSAAPVTANPTAAAASASTKALTASTGTSIVTVKTTAPVVVPQEGVFVKVSYLGGYSGTYGLTGSLEKALGSGDQVYAVNATGGTVQAKFQKRDGSSSHDLIVEIWKGGKAIATQKNSSAYGIVSISSTV
jgi:hypothetical protein